MENDWQYSGKGNPFATAMMNAGMPEYSRGPRLAFYGDDKAVAAAGFPLDHPDSYTSPVTGQHHAWVPDTGMEMRDTNATEGVFGDFVKHPNLEKVYPQAMNTPLRKRQMADKGGMAASGNLYLNNKLRKEEEGPIAMHEMQHWINKTRGLTSGKQESGPLEYLFGGNPGYWNSEEETTARRTEDSAARELDGGADLGPWGLDALRNDMIDRTGNKRFYLEK